MRRNNEESTQPETTENKETEKPVYPTPDGKTVVCLDAGHGFRDIGCDTDFLDGNEAETTLAITLLVKAELEARGAQVILTHDGKTFPSADEVRRLADSAGVEYKEEDIIDNDIFSAYERAVYTAAIAEDKAIDLFISLHVNSLPTHPEFSRYEMDYFAENPYADALGEFCKDLAGALDNESKIFADIYEEAFLVTKVGAHPSVLIEMGYATNEEDSARLNSKEWREDFAKALSDSCIKWISSYEEK